MAREMNAVTEGHRLAARLPCNVKIYSEQTLCLVCGHQWDTGDFRPCPYKVIAPKGRGSSALMGFILVLSSFVLAIIAFTAFAYYLI